MRHYILQEQAIAELEEKGAIKVYGSEDLAKGWRLWLGLKNRQRRNFQIKLLSGKPEVLDRLRPVDLRGVTLLCTQFGDAELSNLVAVAPNIRTLNIRRSSISNDGLKAIRKLEVTLLSLSLGDMFVFPDYGPKGGNRWWVYRQDQFSDEAIEHLAGLRLAHLTLVSNGFGNRDLSGLDKIRNLFRITVASDRINDRCMKALGGAGALMVSGGSVTEKGILQLPFGKIRELVFRKTQLNSECPQAISQIGKWLNTLILEETGLTDTSLAGMRNLDQLQCLALWGDPLTSDVLNWLPKLPNLSRFHAPTSDVDLKKSPMLFDRVSTIAPSKYLRFYPITTRNILPPSTPLMLFGLRGETVNRLQGSPFSYFPLTPEMNLREAYLVIPNMNCNIRPESNDE
jgi:hypothetical protein